MKRITIVAAALLLALRVCQAQAPDTLRVSDLFTTHIVFDTDLIYADLSNSQACAAKILEQSRNMMALKARAPFSTPLSVSALESNGVMHTYVVLFDEHPAALVHDMRSDGTDGHGAALFRKGDAPLLKDVVDAPQRLWHLSSRRYGMEVTCTNILSYSDVTYLVFSVRNRSGVSYECADATFVLESGKRSKRSVVYDRNIFPKSRSGSLSCAPGETARIGYTLEKVTLSKGQVLRVYFYEEGGQREVVLTVNARDINRARTTPD